MLGLDKVIQMLELDKVTQFLPQLVTWRVVNPNGLTTTSLLLTICGKNFVTLSGPNVFQMVFINSQPLRAKKKKKNVE